MFVDGADVTRPPPAVEEPVGVVGQLEVGFGDPRATHDQLAHGLSVARKLIALRIDGLQFDTDDGQTL